MTASAAPLVLLVDDEPLVLSAMQRTLGGQRCRLLTTTDPGHALELALHEPIDVLISDLDMPGMSGLELVAQLRHQRPAVVRILLTGRGSYETAVRAINEGEVHRYLTKPWDRDAIRSVVADAAAQGVAGRRAAETAHAELLGRTRLAALALRWPGLTDGAPRLGDAPATSPLDGVYCIDELRACRARL